MDTSGKPAIVSAGSHHRARLGRGVSGEGLSELQKQRLSNLQENYRLVNRRPRPPFSPADIREYLGTSGSRSKSSYQDLMAAEIVEAIQDEQLLDLGLPIEPVESPSNTGARAVFVRNRSSVSCSQTRGYWRGRRRRSVLLYCGY